VRVAGSGGRGWLNASPIVRVRRDGGSACGRGWLNEVPIII
jgi:hypothetical protein